MSYLASTWLRASATLAAATLLATVIACGSDEEGEGIPDPGSAYSPGNAPSQNPVSPGASAPPVPTQEPEPEPEPEPDASMPVDAGDTDAAPTPDAGSDAAPDPDAAP